MNNGNQPIDNESSQTQSEKLTVSATLIVSPLSFSNAATSATMALTCGGGKASDMFCLVIRASCAWFVIDVDVKAARYVLCVKSVRFFVGGKLCIDLPGSY